MGFTGYVRAAIDLAVLTLLAANYFKLRSLPARVLRLVDAARARGGNDVAAECAGVVGNVAAEASGIVAGLHALHEQLLEIVRAERGAAEVRARVAERRAELAAARAAGGHGEGESEDERPTVLPEPRDSLPSS